MPCRLLFPLAAAFACGIVPLWLYLRATQPAFATASWHGHEMIFGFAPAVIAGFLVTRRSRSVTLLLAASWLCARIAVLVTPGPLAMLAGLAFPVALPALALAPLLAGAKRPQNLILPAILATLPVADAAWWTGALWSGPLLQARALLCATDVLALLLLVMGGRILRAAAGNLIEQQDGPRLDFGQRSHELPLAALAAGMILFDAAGLHAVAGMLCCAAALLATLRMTRWQLHRTLGEPAVWSLALGYLWLVAGLLLKGTAQLTGLMPYAPLLHGIGIGALGTLTLVMMARTAALRAHRALGRCRDIGAAALLISMAALCRIGAPLVPAAQDVLLWLSAAAWCGAFLILLIRLLRPDQPRMLRTADTPENT